MRELFTISFVPNEGGTITNEGYFKEEEARIRKMILEETVQIISFYKTTIR